MQCGATEDMALLPAHSARMAVYVFLLWCVSLMLVSSSRTHEDLEAKQKDLTTKHNWLESADAKLREEVFSLCKDRESAHRIIIMCDENTSVWSDVNFGVVLLVCVEP